ncbi:Pr6Pr family membrane protein [Rhodococcus sp. NPDC058505]|uniref:Pr6Pr family membrane protein n=1 Tax=unclassified Rhodococcus (in: high G+C Gram-positive bacteria) TaxID=192944 RepID=UPI003660BB5D
MTTASHGTASSTPRPACPHTPPAVRVLRVALAVLGAVALAWLPIHEAGEPDFDLVSYFSYFTVLSNVLAVVVLAVGAVIDPQGERWQSFRGAVTVYMVITGIVYAVLLANVDVGGQGQWTNDVVHRVMPLVILLDWVVFPARRRISDATAMTWVWFPVLYGVYTLIRGPIVAWYPYPFIDPRQQGPLQMAIGLVVLVVAFLLISLAVNVAGRLGARWRYGDRTVPASDAGVDRKVEQ